MSGATNHWWCTILDRARLEGPLSQLFPWKTEPRPICPKLTGDLPHGRGCLPWRQQVPSTIPWGAVQVWVNVPNHVQSHWPWMMHHPGQGQAGRTLVSTVPLKNWTQVDLPKTHREPSPWWGLPPLKMASPYHHPSRSSKGASRCAKLCLELLNVHHAHESGGAGLISPLAQIPLKTEPGLICLKLIGDLPLTKDHLPWRW